MASSPVRAAAAVPARARVKRARSGPASSFQPTGYIVTNNHLIQKRVRQRNRRSGHGDADQPPRNIRRASSAAIPLPTCALLKIEGQNLPFVNWGDSTRARVGDWVLAIRQPLTASAAP
jgi:serine protease Do